MRSGVRLGPSQSPRSEFFAWEFPGAPARVHLHLGVVEDLSRQLQWLYQYNPDAQLFGILLGRVNPNGAIIIDDFERVEGGEDPERLKPVLAQWASKTDAKVRVVGYYRSHLRDGFGLSSDDLTLLFSQFPAPLSVVMLIKPSATAVATAGFFFAINGEAKSMFSFGRFPFDRRNLEAERRAAESKTGEKAAPEVQTVRESSSADAGTVVRMPGRAEARAENPEPTQSQPAGPPHGWVWFTIAALIAVLALGVQIFDWFGLPPEAAVALTAARVGRGVEISWNRDARLFNGDGALLYIREDQYQKQVYLDLPKLRAGHILYYPHSNGEVNVRMEVLLRGGQGTATVDAVAEAARRMPVETAAANPAESVTSTASQAPSETVAASSGSRAGSALAVPEAPDPPVVMSLPGSVQEVAVTAGTHSVTLPASTGGSGSVQLSPDAAAQPNSTSVVKLDAGNAFVEPRVTHSVMPEMPSDRSVWHGDATLIDVLVQIDTDGRVILAVPRHPKTKAGTVLAKLAVDAAEQWRFEPAYREGKKIPSQMLLRFQF